MVLQLVDDLDETLHLDPEDALMDREEKFYIVAARKKQRRKSPADKLRDKILEVRFSVPKASLMLKSTLLGEKETNIVNVRNFSNIFRIPVSNFILFSVCHRFSWQGWLVSLCTVSLILLYLLAFTIFL